MSQENVITVETISGQQLRFVADRPDQIESQLKGMDPQTYFQRKQLYFSHASMLAGVACDKTAVVRFDFPLDPGWAFPFEASRVDLIDKEQFDQQVQVKRVQARVILQNALLGTDIVILQKVSLVNGASLHFRVAIKTVPAAIRLQNVDNSAMLKTYFAFTPTGYMLLNASAVEYWHAYPGPLVAPANAISCSDELPAGEVAES